MRIWIMFYFFLPILLFSQEREAVSIHRMEFDKYRTLGAKSAESYDLLNGYHPMVTTSLDSVDLTHRIFGYHPYWAGSNYLNYQWDLLSDLCYFSYEVDPATGLPETTHEWANSPAIDSALAHGVKVHLCVTLFSGHGTFFSNPEAQQTLIENIIELVATRPADGVNMDVEALPSVYKEEFLAFMIALCEQMNQELPGAEVSIAAPAVNWSEKFNVAVLNEYIDFFMVMGYDYYWNGSSQAGPVSPLYPMISWYTYNFSRTISYYQSQGVPDDRIIMGVPYYAYQWKTEGQFAPSATIGQGQAYTYRNIMDNSSGHYSAENKHMEPNSFGPYYSFENNGWNQCFLDDVYSLGEKYDIIERRNLGGIGIWALGYDNGHEDLWNLILDKFTTGSLAVDADTIYDSGGPAFDYYDDEHYLYTLQTSPGTNLYLSFSYLDTEENYDTLWIYDGSDPSSVLIGTYSGDDVPELIEASANTISLKFYSDGATVDAGWSAVYDTLPVSNVSVRKQIPFLDLHPNPATETIGIDCSLLPEGGKLFIQVLDFKGVVYKEILTKNSGESIYLDVSSWKKGMYIVLLTGESGAVGQAKFIVN